MAIKALWNWIGTNKEQIKILMALIVACFVLWQYYDRWHESRIAESLKYIERYQTGEIYDARTTLSLFWRSEQGRKLLGSTKEEMKEWPKRAKSALERYNHHPSVCALLWFFRDLAICAKEGVCDKETLCTFFKQDIEAFKNLYNEVFREWGESWAQSFDKEMKEFLEDCVEGHVRAESALHPVILETVMGDARAGIA